MPSSLPYRSAITPVGALFLLGSAVACHRQSPGLPAASVVLSPASPTAADAITAVVGASGNSGDTLTTGYAWTVNGAAYATASDAATVGPFPKASVVQVDVTVTDKTSTGTATASVTIADSAPTAPVASIVATADPQNPGSDTLRCEAATPSTDVDGDALTYTVSWTMDGEPYTGATDLLAGDTIFAADTARGATWVCSLTASDGELTSAPGTASVQYDDPAPNEYGFEKIVDLPAPADIAVLPDDTILVTSLIGDLYHVDVKSKVILSSTNLGNPDDLIGLALDPRYGDGTHDNLFVWTNQTCAIQRWHVDSLDPLTVSGEVDVLTVPCPVGTPGHCGGDIKFHGDVAGNPILYLVTGPVGDIDDSDPNTPAGKLWAMTVSDAGVASPAFSSPWGNGYFVAMGLRNPWRILNCGDGLCIPDPGVDTTEELNYFDPAVGNTGANYGFPACEGPCVPENPDYIQPIFSFNDDGDQSYLDADLDGGDHSGFVCTPSAGLRMDGLPFAGRLDGYVLVSDFYAGWIQGVPLNDAGVPQGAPVPLAHLPWLMSMEELSDGTVVAAELGGSLQKMIVRADRAQVGAAGEKLSATSWVDGGVGYTPLYPLWSNGAGKNRFIQLPAGQSIDTTDPENWVFPVGTKLWKDFDMNGTPAETRVLEKTADGWVPGVYVWDGDDATLSNGFRSEVTLSDGTHYIVPSTETCKDCHQGTRGGDWALGVNPLQLGDTGLADFASVLSQPVGSAPTITGDATTVFARGYLNANCALCHNPAGITASTTTLHLDFRYDTPLDQMGLNDIAHYYNANPNLSNGLPYVDTTDPSASILTQVMAQGDMPPVLLQTPDTTSIHRLDDWISGLSGY